jgi:response regulator of citrate/malate metabolism
MMSGDDENELVSWCLRTGAVDYFVKPVTVKVLRALKERLIS